MSDTENFDLDVTIPDFNLDTDILPDILIPNGDYTGNISDTVWNTSRGTMDITVVFQEDGRVMSDEKTLVGGKSEVFSIWFPLEGDESKPSKKPGVSEKQRKLKWVGIALKQLKISASTKKDLIALCENKSLIGKLVVASVSATSWKGQLFNKISALVGLD